MPVLATTPTSRFEKQMSRNMRKPVICIYYNTDEDQMCSSSTADQGLCFRSRGSAMFQIKLLAFFYDCTGRFVSNPVGNQEETYLKMVSNVCINGWA